MEERGEKILLKTLSICPECYKVLPAEIIERDGKVYIKRKCEEHGEIEEIYWADAELFKKALKFSAPEVKLTGTQTKTVKGCPFDCGLCEKHKNQTALANIVLTNRCDLSCWYCFFYAEKAGYVYEPSIEDIRRMVRVLRSQGPFKPNAVQLTGGEPLLRDDLVEIVKMLKEEGIVHVQLNTNGIRFARIWFEEGFEKAVKFAKELRKAGVNTIYLSFDGVTPKTNPKNHWEIPYIFEVFRAADITSVVLVPTVINGYNTHEVGDIVRFAAYNIDIVRGVNFQPISITGKVPRSERKRLRITIPEVIKLIEEQTNGEIPRDAWYPIPWAYAFGAFIEAISGKPALKMANHPACGMATYVFPEFEKKNRKRVIKRFVPITEFVDVEGVYNLTRELTEAVTSGKIGRKRALLRFLLSFRKLIDIKRAPKGLRIRWLLAKITIKRNYKALGEFHKRALFLGMMHFMDLYNYDLARVSRCSIHYLVPDGRLIPFCTFNVLSDIYRDEIQKRFSIPLDKWVELRGKHTIGDAIKYKRDIKKLTSNPIYKKAYEPFIGEKR